MSEASSARSRNLRTVGLLAAIYLVPLALAFLAYYGTGWRPAGHVNHGTLITPPRPLPALALPQAGGVQAAPLTFRGLWTLVYIGAGGCDADCERALLVMRQTRLGLNYNMARVARVFLVSGGCGSRPARARRGCAPRRTPGSSCSMRPGPRPRRCSRSFPWTGARIRSTWSTRSATS